MIGEAGVVPARLGVAKEVEDLHGSSLEGASAGQERRRAPVDDSSFGGTGPGAASPSRKGSRRQHAIARETPERGSARTPELLRAEDPERVRTGATGGAAAPPGERLRQVRRLRQRGPGQQVLRLPEDLRATTGTHDPPGRRIRIPLPPHGSDQRQVHGGSLSSRGPDRVCFVIALDRARRRTDARVRPQLWHPVSGRPRLRRQPPAPRDDVLPDSCSARGASVWHRVEPAPAGTSSGSRRGHF